MTRRLLAATCISLLVSTGTAGAGTAEPVGVAIDHKMYDLVTDLNANGIPEVLLLRREVRRRGTTLVRVTTVVDVLEPLPRRADFGRRLNGRRYRPVAHYSFDGLSPGDGFPHQDSIVGSLQGRYGMLGVVLLPLRVVGRSEVVTLRIFNTDRGRYDASLGPQDFASVAEPSARAYFAEVAGDDHRPAAVALLDQP